MADETDIEPGADQVVRDAYRRTPGASAFPEVIPLSTGSPQPPAPVPQPTVKMELYSHVTPLLVKSATIVSNALTDGEEKPWFALQVLGTCITAIQNGAKIDLARRRLMLAERNLAGKGGVRDQAVRDTLAQIAELNKILPQSQKRRLEKAQASLEASLAFEDGLMDEDDEDELEIVESEVKEPKARRGRRAQASS